jgi:hypothetical protein
MRNPPLTLLSLTSYQLPATSKSSNISNQQRATSKSSPQPALQVWGVVCKLQQAAISDKRQATSSNKDKQVQQTPGWS